MHTEILKAVKNFFILFFSFRLETYLRNIAKFADEVTLSQSASDAGRSRFLNYYICISACGCKKKFFIAQAVRTGSLSDFDEAHQSVQETIAEVRSFFSGTSVRFKLNA